MTLWGVELLPPAAEEETALSSSSMGGLTEEEYRMQEADDFLQGLYVRVAAEEIPAAMDSVIEHIDDLLNENLLSVCDYILEELDLRRVPSNVRSAFLMATYPVRKKLLNREALYREALAVLSHEKGLSVAERMLSPLH